MDIIMFSVLVVITLYAYSFGVVIDTRKSIEIKFHFFDLIAIACVWVLSWFIRDMSTYSIWLFILVCVLVSFEMGIGRAFLFQIRTVEQIETIITHGSLWHRWSGFSKRVGEFQGKMILAIFYFTIVMPFALAVKVFADPMGIKQKRRSSCWISKVQADVGLEHFRRQF